MKSRLNIRERMKRSITMRRGEIILRSDFTHMGSQSQISRLLTDFVAEGRLVRLGYGIFAKARISSISGQPVPREPLEVLAEEAFMRLRIEAKPGKAQRDYASGQSPQIPVQAVFDTGRRRISRELMVGNRKVRYENDYNR
ncbi:MAG TPA: S-adenosylhomocysteine hydrolase [Chlorobaculum parvum]|uniref:S-adenosylhomocysteine hydrolase n=1 Tax=Chlorobaculum parvum TaxID=274539 RepID=A0A7C5DEM8_9CHLB|nr:S-adenosylhomocysteine hydrolase [Chlorobaculum parvum]